MANSNQTIPADARRALIVLPTWVGDFVMATPILRTIRARFSDARITFLTESNLVDLIRGGPWMDEVVEWPDKAQRSLMHRAYREFVGELRSRQFDAAILLPNSFRAALTARLAGAKRRIGYDRDGRGFLLTDRVPVKNLRADVERRRATGESHGQTSLPIPPGPEGTSARPPEFLPPRLPVKPSRFVPMRLTTYYDDLAEAIGCDKPGDRFELFTTPDGDEAVTGRLSEIGIAKDKPVVVLSPGAKYGAAKCWMPDRFAKVADRLIEEFGAAVIVTCGPGEQHIAHAIGDEMQQKHFVFDQPLLTLGQLKSLIKRSDLLICNDAGPRHFAKAFDVPVVTVFGPTHPEWTATEYPKETVVRIDVDCGPCQQRKCPLNHLECMTGVTVDAVHTAAAAWLRMDNRSPLSEPARG